MPDDLTTRLRATGLEACEEYAEWDQKPWVHKRRADAALTALLDELGTLTSHAPDGHNVTNEQFVNERQRADAAEARVKELEAERGASSVFYRYITDTCRQRPKDDIMEEVVHGLRDELSACLDGWRGHSGVIFHVRLSIQRLTAQPGAGKEAKP